MSTAFLSSSESRSYPFVSYERNAGLSRIHIHGPRPGNPLNTAVLFELYLTVQTAIEDPQTHGIVITAAQPGFVQGADLHYLVKNIADDRFDRIHYYSQLGNDCFDLIATSPKRVVAFVNGAALGGGFELALACSDRYVLRTSSFSLPETGIGVCPLWGGIPRLTKLLGQDMAKWLVYSGKIISANDAVQWGIAESIVEPENIEATIENIDWKLLRECKILPTPDELLSVVSYFHEYSAQDIYYNPLPETTDKLLLKTVRGVKRNSILALRCSELIFENSDESTVQRDVFYSKIVEYLYRTEDTKTGLEWKNQGKLGQPVFPSANNPPNKINEIEENILRYNTSYQKNEKR